MRYRNFAFLSVLALFLAGCPTATQEKAAQASLEASIVIQTGQQAEIAAFNQQLIPVSEHQFIETQFGSLAVIGKTADSCIAGANAQAATLVCLNTALNGVDSIYSNGGLYLKSQQARSIYQVAVGGFRSALASIIVALGGTAPATPTFAGGAA